LPPVKLECRKSGPELVAALQPKGGEKDKESGKRFLGRLVGAQGLKEKEDRRDSERRATAIPAVAPGQLPAELVGWDSQFKVELRTHEAEN
jgi:hypothetical protein